METINLDVLTRPFDPAQIRQREGRGGTRLDYLETHSVIARLNEAFNGAWSFEVVHHEVTETEAIVHGRLTAGGQSKTQFGGSDIARHRDSGKPISLSDDLKAAASDALKKCATLFGVGLHLYDKPQTAQRPQQTAQRPQADRSRDSRRTRSRGPLTGRRACIVGRTATAAARTVAQPPGEGKQGREPSPVIQGGIRNSKEAHQDRPCAGQPARSPVRKRTGKLPAGHHGPEPYTATGHRFRSVRRKAERGRA